MARNKIQQLWENACPKLQVLKNQERVQEEPMSFSQEVPSHAACLCSQPRDMKVKGGTKGM